jgi:ribosomal protein S18 acetylase RimI-like enzyme
VGASDRIFIRDLSRRVFSRFGHYDRMIPGWLDAAGVWGFLALEDGEPAGFALVSLTRLPAATRLDRQGSQEPPLALDLMAIAVEPERQGRGTGRYLLEAVLQEAHHMASDTDLPLGAVSLTVAVDNHPARKLFRSAGFHETAGDGETYPRGQEALKMVRVVPGKEQGAG